MLRAPAQLAHPLLQFRLRELLQVSVHGKGKINGMLGSSLSKPPGSHRGEWAVWGDAKGRPSDHRIQVCPQSRLPTLMPISVELATVDSLHFGKEEGSQC